MEESDGPARSDTRSPARSDTRSPEELAELDRELVAIKRKLSERFDIDMDMDVGPWIDRSISRSISLSIYLSVTDDILCALD